MKYFLILILFTASCSNRKQSVADSAASIWEAAEAIECGASQPHCIAIIRLQSYAIIRAMGRTYKPAETKQSESD